jgi:2-amino-4-hydroxy-6-hydroxymethyldihydropteridine diphosphokinase
MTNDAGPRNLLPPKALFKAAFEPSERVSTDTKPSVDIGESISRATPVVAYLSTYISLGSNVGDREAQLREALHRLSAAGKLAAVSSFYETEPVEFTEQPWFLNCAVALQTSLLPAQLMASILQIEQQMGRRRTQKKGPRAIDLDLLLYADAVINSADLTIPHPAMQERRFVLEPLAEIAPDVIHPFLKKTIRELQEELPQGQVVRKLDSVRKSS